MHSKPATLNGEACVLVRRREYERMACFMREAALARLPEPDERGFYPALETSCAMTARDMSVRRIAAGWTRAELAALAHVRVASVERLESGRHRTSRAVLGRILAALARAARRRNPTRPRA